jgi:hypothetical protein
MVASVVVSMALIGVYAVFRQALSVEENAFRLWDDRAAAADVVTHVAEALEQAVNLPGVPAIVGGPGEEENEYVLTCTALSGGYREGGRGAVQRRRYRWWHDPEVSDSGVLELRVMTYAGTSNVTPINGLADLEEKQAWEQLEPKLIGKRLRSMSVSYRPTNDEDAEWKDRWHGRGGDVMIRISVTVGNQKCERIIRPRADASWIEQQEAAP